MASLYLFPGYLTPAAAQELPFLYLDVDDGVPLSTVSALVEDSRGFLWVGTLGGGVARFDGSEFVSYSVHEGLPSSRVYTLAEAGGLLFVGTDAGLVSFDGRRFRQVAGPLGNSRITALASVGPYAVELWAATEDSESSGVWLVDLQSPDVPTLAPGAPWRGSDPSTPVSLVTPRPDCDDMGSSVWMADGEGVHRLQRDGDSGFELVAAGQGQAIPGAVSALARGVSCSIWAASPSGLWQYDGQTWALAVSAETLSVESLSTKTPDPSVEVRTLVVDTQGELWAGTRHHGLLRWNGESLSRYASSQGLLSDNILASWVDAGGTLWLGSFGTGLVQLASRSLTRYTLNDGLRDLKVVSIAQAGPDRLYVGSVEGGVQRLDTRTHRFDDGVPGLPDSVRVSSVHSRSVTDGGDPQRELWVATLGQGLWRVLDDRADRVEHWSVSDGGLSSNVLFHVTASDHETWVAAWRGGVHRWEDGQMTGSWGADDGLPSDRVFSTAHGPGGEVWAMTAAGPARLEGERWRTWPQAPSGPSVRYLGAAMAHGSWWFATSAGLVRFDGEAWTSLGLRSGLSSETLYSCHLDRQGHLWVGSDRGVDRLAFDEGGQIVEIVPFGRAEGFVGIETNQNAVFEDEDGSLWFGTRGLARYRPRLDEDARDSAAPRVFITSVQVNSEELKASSSAAGDWFGLPNEAMEIPYGSPMRFAFTGVDLSASDKLSYRYRLRGDSEGSEAPWSLPTRDRSVNFDGVAPGTHSFEVVAQLDQRSSEVAAYRFVVRSPLWLRRDAWLIAGLAVLGSVAAGVRWRQERHRQAKRQLEDEVARRTAELDEARSLAEEALHAKSLFLAKMSHELRTPLQGVLGVADLLATTELAQTQRDYVGTISQSGRSLLVLIDDILDVSKLEAAAIALDPKPTSLADLTAEVVHALRDQRRPDTEIATQIGDDVPECVEIDPQRLRQILINLLSNALKFTLEGKVQLNVSLQEDELHLAVSDTGIGISAEKIGSLFQPFSQVDSSISRRFGGSGLGLAISSGLAELMGGTIEVRSEVEEGSTFTLRLPLALCDSPREQRARARPGRRFQGRVLLVEDDATNRLVLVHQLEFFGIDPQIAEDGDEAWRMLNGDESFDLVLMDCHLPGVDGFALTRRWRQAEDDSKRLPIVALTAAVTPQDRKRSREAGMDAFLSKPTSLQVLGDELARWLDPAAGSA